MQTLNSERPAWLPRWDDADAYPKKFSEWSLTRWAWEFLRRNCEYQRDLEHFDSIPRVFPEGSHNTSPKYGGEVAGEGVPMAFRYCDPPARPGELWEDYWERNDGKVIEEMPYEEFYCRKWKTCFLPNPAEQNGWKWVTFDGYSPLELIEIPPPDTCRLAYPMPEPDEWHHLTLRFDLRFNLEIQLKKALALLNASKGRVEGQRIRAPSRHWNNLPLVLRAFDAKHAGAGIREIAKKLLPRKAGDENSLPSAERAIERAISKGEKMVDGKGYVNLIEFV